MTALDWLIDNANYEGDDCLPWPFCRTAKGYPAKVKRLPFNAPHRWMCARRNGAPTVDKNLATHTCGNGHLGCVNPKHLRWGNHKTNGADMIAHGRSLRGSKAWNNKLSVDDVHRLRSEYANGNYSVAELAEQFGIAAHTVVAVCRKSSWSWLDSPSQMLAVAPRKQRIGKRGEVATKIMALAGNGLGPTAIAKQIGCTADYVGTVLRRPDLYGDIKSNGS